MNVPGGRQLRLVSTVAAAVGLLLTSAQYLCVLKTEKHSCSSASPPGTLRSISQCLKSL